MLLWQHLKKCWWIFFGSGGVACLLAMWALERAKKPPELIVGCCSPSPFQETVCCKHKLMSAPLPVCVLHLEQRLYFLREHRGTQSIKAWVQGVHCCSPQCWDPRGCPREDPTRSPTEQQGSNRGAEPQAHSQLASGFLPPALSSKCSSRAWENIAAVLVLSTSKQVCLSLSGDVRLQTN